MLKDLLALLNEQIIASSHRATANIKYLLLFFGKSLVFNH